MENVVIRERLRNINISINSFGEWLFIKILILAMNINMMIHNVKGING